GGECLQAEITRDAVLEMDDEIAFVQLAEIDLRAVRLLARAAQREPACTGAAIAAEQFRVGKNRDFCCRKSEAARDDTDQKRDVLVFLIGQQFAQPLDLSFVVAKNKRAPAGLTSFAQLSKELVAL